MITEVSRNMSTRLAILAGIVTGEEATRVMERTLNDSSFDTGDNLLPLLCASGIEGCRYGRSPARQSADLARPDGIGANNLGGDARTDPFRLPRLGSQP